MFNKKEKLKKQLLELHKYASQLPPEIEDMFWHFAIVRLQGHKTLRREISFAKAVFNYQATKQMKNRSKHLLGR